MIPLYFKSVISEILHFSLFFNILQFCEFQIAVELYEMLLAVDQQSQQIVHADTISDFLYPYKLYQHVCLFGKGVVLMCVGVGRGDKLENFDLIFFPTSKTWKGLLTTN